MAVRREVCVAALVLALAAAGAKPADATFGWLFNWFGGGKNQPDPPKCWDGSAAKCNYMSGDCYWGKKSINQWWGKWNNKFECSDRLNWWNLKNQCNYWGGDGVAVGTEGYIYIEQGDDDYYNFNVQTSDGAETTVAIDDTSLLDSTAGKMSTGRWLSKGYHKCSIKFGGGGYQPSCNLQWQGKNCDGNGNNRWCQLPKKKWCQCPPKPPTPPPANPTPAPIPDTMCPDKVTKPDCDGTCGGPICKCYSNNYGYDFTSLDSLKSKLSKFFKWSNDDKLDWFGGRGLKEKCGEAVTAANWIGYMQIKNAGDYTFHLDISGGAAELLVDGAIVIASGSTSGKVTLSVGKKLITLNYACAGTSTTPKVSLKWSGQYCGCGSADKCSVPKTAWCCCPPPTSWK